MTRLTMTATQRAALADAIRDMRQSGVRPRDIIASGAPSKVVRHSPVAALRLRLAAKAVRP